MEYKKQLSSLVTVVLVDVYVRGSSVLYKGASHFTSHLHVTSVLLLTLHVSGLVIEGPQCVPESEGDAYSVPYKGLHD